MEHFYRREESNDVLRAMTKGTRTAELSPAERCAAHWRAILSHSTFSSKPGPRGRTFERVLYDGLVSAGINPVRITMNIDVTKKGRKLHAEVDILIEPAHEGKKACGYSKTSMRERWKQIDRDGMIAKQVFGDKYVHNVGITWAEKTNGDTRENLDRQTKKLEVWSDSIDEYISILQTEKFNALMDFIKAQ